MSTQSIFDNIVIKDKKSAESFIEAVEKAEKIAKPIKMNYTVTELKDKDEIKKFFEGISFSDDKK